MKNNKKMVRLLSLVLISLVLLTSTLLILTNIPIHRFNIYNSDSISDVEDENVEIISVKSSDYNDQYILLELAVAGEISDETNYAYSMFIIGKSSETGQTSIIGTTEYYDGEAINKNTNENLETTIVNDNVLQILYPKATFFSPFYMIGLEGKATHHNSDNIDLTKEDRSGEISTLL